MKKLKCTIIIMLACFACFIGFIGCNHNTGLLKGDYINGQSSSTYVPQSFVTPYVIPYASTVTITKVNGPWQTYTPTSNTVIYIENGDTNYVNSIRLELIAGTNSITLPTNNVTYSSVTISTNSPTSILYDSQYGATNWRAWKLGS